MRILMTGATGFLGHAIARGLLLKGHELVVLSRDAARASERFPYPARFHDWDPMRGPPPVSAWEGVEAVVHLAGESVAAQRWSAEQKRRIRDSRVLGTRHLWDGILAQEGLVSSLRAFVSASAIGYYGDRGDEWLTEEEGPGRGFLAEVCLDWEKEVFRAEAASVRRVAVRTGIVLGRDGGALASLLPIFEKGAGGPAGGGRQWMSWIHLEDAASVYVEAVENGALSGPVNAVAPEPVTNAEFARLLGAVLGKRAFLPAPAFALKAALGEMSSMVLEGQRLRPVKLERAGFKFAYPHAVSALADLCAPEGEPGDDRFVAEQWVPRPVEEVFGFFTEARNLEELTPPWLSFEIERVTDEKIRSGTLIDYRLRIHGVPARWRTRIEEWEPGARFVDVQLKGPYAKWHHTHRFVSVAGGTLVSDRVVYRLPLGGLGKAVAGSLVKGDVEKIFDYRRKRIREVFGTR